MKVWRRIFPGGKSSLGLSYKVVTEIDEAGNYRAMNVWSDGLVDVVATSTLAAMGWPSVEEFLKNKTHFEPVEEDCNA